MLPAVFGENLFDEMFDDMMRPMHSMEKALYGKHARAIMKTDVRETDNSYEVDIDLPGFKKDEGQRPAGGRLPDCQRRQGFGQRRKEEGPLHPAGALRRPVQPQLLCRESVKPKDVHAKFEDGILKLSLPKLNSQDCPDHRTITIE